MHLLSGQCGLPRESIRLSWGNTINLQQNQRKVVCDSNEMVMSESIFYYFESVNDHLNLGFVMSLSIHVYVWRVYFYVIFVSVCVYTEVLCQGDRTTFDVHIW